MISGRSWEVEKLLGRIDYRFDFVHQFFNLVVDPHCC